MLYMIHTWWMHLTEVLGQYFIWNGAIENLMVMAYNIMTLGYTYTIYRLNKTSDIIYTSTKLRHLITWTPSRLACVMDLKGIDQSLNRLTGTYNK